MFELIIAWNQNREPLAGSWIFQPKAMVAVRIAHHDVAAALIHSIRGGGRQRGRIERLDVDEPRRRGHKNDRVGDQLGQP